MITRKDFNLAAIRVFCDMIVADGYVVDDELTKLAEIAMDYKLTTSDTKISRRNEKQKNGDKHDDANIQEILKGLNVTLIQEAYKKSFSEALYDIKEWGKNHEMDVKKFTSQLAEMSEVDGECSPNEARIRLAVGYVLGKDAVACSIETSYKFSKKEIIYVENDIYDDAVVNSVKRSCWGHETSDIWMGFLEYKTKHGIKSDNESQAFEKYIREYYQKINQEIDCNYPRLQRELGFLGFDLVYIPQSISNLMKFGDGPELLLPALQVMNPLKLYGKDYANVAQELKTITTHDVVCDMIQGYDVHVTDVTPALLVKIGTSDVIKVLKAGKDDVTGKEKYENAIQHLSDFLIIKIENGSLKMTIDKYISNYQSIAKHLTHMVTAFTDTRVNIHGFDHTLLDYAINRVYGKASNRVLGEASVKRIEFNLRHRKVCFSFGGKIIKDEIRLSERAITFYLFVICKPIPVPTPVESYKIFNIIYRSLPSCQYKDLKSSKFAKDKKEVKDKLEDRLKEGFDYTSFIPLCLRRGSDNDQEQICFYGFPLEKYEIFKKITFVKVPAVRNPMNISEWFDTIIRELNA